jgi:RES domain-containing protein
VPPPRARHDRELLDALEALPSGPFTGEAWRVVRAGRDPWQGSVAAARWNPAGTVEALYTSLDRDGALAEVHYHLSLAPVFPSVEFNIYKLAVALRRVIRFDSVPALAGLGVAETDFRKRDYARSQAIGAAAHFLSCDGLIVPNARRPCLNLVIFLDMLDPNVEQRIVDEHPVDWRKWLEEQRSS